MRTRAYKHIRSGASESDIFKAHSDFTRLRVLNFFLAAKDSLCVCEIVDALKIPQYNMSKQLSLLRQTGIVEVEKKGLWGYYHLKDNVHANRVLFSFLKRYLEDETFKQEYTQS